MKLSELTNQEIFNKVVAGLAAQGFQQCGTEDICQYYDPATGYRCAIGQLIPPEEYSESLEGKGVEKLEIFLGYSPAQIGFLRLLQIAHDASDTPDFMKDKLRNMAAAYNLELPEALK